MHRRRATLARLKVRWRSRGSSLADGSAKALLAEAKTAGARFGVQATPTWLIAGQLVSGLRPEAEFEALAGGATRQAG